MGARSWLPQCPCIAWAASAARAPFGTLPDGTAIEAVTLRNAHGVSARIITYGATLQALVAPDRRGHPADIALGYDDLAGYVQHPNYFGATIGRFANRIAGARFTLDGKSYALALNDKPNSLHGGTARGSISKSGASRPPSPPPRRASPCH